jgi:hypothetical protein
MTAIDKDDKDAADKYLAELEVQNLYEDSFLAYSKYFYDRKWGTEVEQLADLRRAIADEKIDRYLPEGAFVDALTAKFALEVKSSDYGNALATWAVLGPVARKESLSGLQQAVDDMNRIRDSDESVRLSARIEKGTSWSGRMFKKRFYLDVKNGEVSEIKLRCEKQYVYFKYDPTLRYSVSGKSGECYIEVVGDPGTSFDLVQS